MKRYVLVMLAAACGSTAPGMQPVIGSPTTNSPVRMTIADGQDLGLFGVVPTRAETASSWVPVGMDTLYWLGVNERSAATMPTLAIDAKGTISKIAYTADRDLAHGCDNNTVHVSAFAGDPRDLAPGVAWMIPPGVPASWQPAARAITPGSTSPKARAYSVGPIGIALARTDAKHGTVTFSWDGRPLAPALPIERFDMEGAENDVPIDLAAGGVAVPEPIAAWSIAGPQSPHLVAFLVPSYEGVHVRVAIVDAEHVRDLDDLYLYRCAF